MRRGSIWVKEYSLQELSARERYESKRKRLERTFKYIIICLNTNPENIWNY